MLKHMLRLLARCTSADHSRMIERDVMGAPFCLYPLHLPLTSLPLAPHRLPPNQNTPCAPYACAVRRMRVRRMLVRRMRVCVWMGGWLFVWVLTNETAALNYVVLVRTAAKYHVENLEPPQLLELYQDQISGLVEGVILLLEADALQEAHDAHTYLTYTLRAECVLMLLVLAASQLTQPLSLTPIQQSAAGGLGDAFMDCMMVRSSPSLPAPPSLMYGASSYLVPAACYLRCLWCFLWRCFFWLRAC